MIEKIKLNSGQIPGYPREKVGRHALINTVKMLPISVLWRSQAVLHVSETVLRDGILNET